jgi:hypothetical protein
MQRPEDTLVSSAYGILAAQTKNFSVAKISSR